MSTEYDVFIEGEKLGMGLSKGELNQWLLELNEELNQEQKEKFQEDFGCSDISKFEDYLYEKDLELPVVADFGGEILVVNEHDSNI